MQPISPSAIRSLLVHHVTHPESVRPVRCSLLRQTLDALLAIASARLGAGLQVHQLLGCKAGHLAEQVGIGALFHETAQVHHLFGYRVQPSVQVGGHNPTLPRNPMATASHTSSGNVTLHHISLWGYADYMRRLCPTGYWFDIPRLEAVIRPLWHQADHQTLCRG